MGIRTRRCITALALALAVGACDSGHGPRHYTVGGVATGVAGTGLTLELNGAHDLTLPSAAGFVFDASLEPLSSVEPSPTLESVTDMPAPSDPLSVAADNGDVLSPGEECVSPTAGMVLTLCRGVFAMDEPVSERGTPVQPAATPRKGASCCLMCCRLTLHSRHIDSEEAAAQAAQHTTSGPGDCACRAHKHSQVGVQATLAAVVIIVQEVVESIGSVLCAHQRAQSACASRHGHQGCTCACSLT